MDCNSLSRSTNAIQYYFHSYCKARAFLSRRQPETKLWVVFPFIYNSFMPHKLAHFQTPKYTSIHPPFTTQLSLTPLLRPLFPHHRARGRVHLHLRHEGFLTRPAPPPPPPRPPLILLDLHLDLSAVRADLQLLALLVLAGPPVDEVDGREAEDEEHCADRHGEGDGAADGERAGAGGAAFSGRRDAASHGVLR